MKFLLFVSSLVGMVGAACDTSKLAICLSGLGVPSGCGYFDSYLNCLDENSCKDEDQCKVFNDGMETLKAQSTFSNCNQECKPTCFPGTAKVTLESGKTKTMKELEIGDKVQVAPGEFSPVFLFTTQIEETQTKFITFSTAHGELSMTRGHYLYVNGQLKQAREVQVGDALLLANGTKAAVEIISATSAPGLYNPHTLHGDIVVDGFTTSTYTDAVHPTLAHALLAPVRNLYNLGISFGPDFTTALKALPAYILDAVRA